MTTNLVKLTRFDLNSDVWLNPELVQMVQIRDFNDSVQKILITFGMDMDIYVNETLDEVLNILQGRI